MLLHIGRGEHSRLKCPRCTWFPPHMGTTLPERDCCNMSRLLGKIWKNPPIGFWWQLWLTCRPQSARRTLGQKKRWGTRSQSPLEGLVALDDSIHLQKYLDIKYLKSNTTIPRSTCPSQREEYLLGSLSHIPRWLLGQWRRYHTLKHSVLYDTYIKCDNTFL